MANTTVSIRERIKTPDGHWHWSPKIPTPQGKLSPSEAGRKGIFYLVWTENGEKHEQLVEERRFEGAVKAARAKERHLEDLADGFSHPDPLKVAERKTIADAIERRIQSIEISRSADTLKAHRQALRQFEAWSERQYPQRKFVDEIDHDQVMQFRNWAVKSGNEKKNSKKKGNDLLTANWKAMRVNQFVKITRGLRHGEVSLYRRAGEQIDSARADAFHWKHLHSGVLPVEPELLAAGLVFVRYRSRSTRPVRGKSAGLKAKFF
jgi:hypothetical protein